MNDEDIDFIEINDENKESESNIRFYERYINN